METLEKVIAKITVNGKNVTADVSPYLSRLSYADKEEAESDDLTLTFEDTTDHWKNGWYPEQGDTLEVSIGTPDAPLDCGLFEIDEIGLEFPPDTVAIKAIGAAISKALRSKNSKAFEKQSLKQIAQYFATKHGLKLVGNVSDLQKIEVERKTQEKQTDLAFLSRLAREYGIVFSVRGDQLVFMDTEELESQPVVMTIHKNELSRASFTDKTSQVFGGAVVATRNMKTNSVRRWKIEPSDQEGGKGTLSKDTWQGDVTVENETQAQAKAKGALKEKNKDKITGSITVAGNVSIISEIGEGENLGYARVSFDENEIVSGWLAIPSMATYKTKHWIPVEVNAQVLCSMDENCEQGAIVLVLWSDTDTPPDWAGPDTMGVKYADGAEVFYDAKAHKLSVNAPDSELSIACKKLNVEGEVNITGDTTVTGEITASVEVTAGTQKIKLTTHKHPTSTGVSGPPTP